MTHSEATVRALINSSGLHRDFGFPEKTTNGLTVIFYDEAHLLACEELTRDFDKDTAYALFDCAESPTTLAARLGRKMLSFSYALKLVHRDIVICTDNVAMSKMMIVIMATWRSGRNNYSISKFKLPKPRPHLFDERKDEILQVVNSLCDEESVRGYARRIKAFIMGNPGYHDMATYHQYWHPKVRIERDDVVCDAGIGTSVGGTIRFANITGPGGKVFAFEPIKSMWAKLQPECAGVENLELLPLGLWSHKTDIDFFVAGDISTFRALDYTQEAKVETCQLVSVDEFFGERNLVPNLIKMDIEGAEGEALKGAQETITKHKPKLQVCLYHRIEDFIDIPLQVLSYNPDYQFYVGHHTPFYNEFVLYAR